MKKNKLYKVVMLTSILLMIVVIVIISFKTIHRGQKNTDGAIIYDNVTVITAETKKDEQPLKATDNELIFGDNLQFSKGDIIVAGIIDSAPSGFIRKVVGTTEKNHQYIVETENGVLTDVFKEAHITKTFMLEEDGAKEVDYNSIGQAIKTDMVGSTFSVHTLSYNTNRKGIVTVKPMSVLGDGIKYQFAKEFEYDVSKGISAKGAVGFNVWLEVNIDISDGDVIFGVVEHNESDGSLHISASADDEIKFEKELFSKQLPNVQFSIGVVPIVITNEIQSSIEGKGYIHGSIGTMFGIESKNSSGFQYSSKTNEVKEIKEEKYLSDGLQWDTDAKFSNKNFAGVSLHLISKLYDSTGADISVGIEGKTEGEVSVSAEKSLDGLNYVGSVDLAIVPKLTGNILVSVPVIDRQLTERPIFETELKPLWEKHWDSGGNIKMSGLKNTYKTRFGKLKAVTCPQFQFNYSDNWKVTNEEINNNLFAERDVITNSAGATITYMNFASMNGLGDEGRLMYKVEVSKVADSSFTPTVPAGTNSDYSNLGKFIVAKLKIVGELYMNKDSDFTSIDGSVLYAVVPESYVGIHEVVGHSGMYSKFSFKYPSPYAFFAEPIDSNYKFTEDEEKEIIEILSSFKDK